MGNVGYIDVDGKPRTSPRDAAFFLKWVEETLSWARQKANIPKEVDPENWTIC